MNDNLKRIIIATILSFAFFIAYDYFVLEPQIQKTTKDENNKTITSNSKLNEVKTEKINFKNIITITAKNYEIKIDEFGRITKFLLKEKRFNKNGKELNLISSKLPKPLEIRFKDEKLNNLAYKIPVKVDISELNVINNPKTLTMTQDLNGLIVKRIITFYPNGRYDLKLELSKKATYFITPGYRPSVAIDNLTVHGVLVKKSDNTLTLIEDREAEVKSIKNAKIIAGFDRYYTTLLFSKKPFDIVVTPDEDKNPVVFIKSDSSLNLIGYIGPKYVDRLASIDKELIDVVQYGVGTFFAKNLFLLLDFLHKLVGNWGVAIILLVVIVRLFLFPLTYKGMVSMYKLKELAPKMKEIQLKYKNDPQKLQAHMMKLYKEHNANPLGGCLPLLLQIPIFYGIYKLLLYAIELKGAHFLWIKDLSVMDPFFILPILMGITMYIHQKLTPTNFQDKMQEKIFKFLPLIFTFMMATFPAGLVLYWTVNNILSIIQQVAINKIMESKKLLKAKN